MEQPCTRRPHRSSAAPGLGRGGATDYDVTDDLWAANIAARKEKKGYRYVAEINAGIQNVDAEHAWSNTFRLAKTLKLPVEVDFEWLQKNEAAYPGKSGRPLWKPKEEAAQTK